MVLFVIAGFLYGSPTGVDEDAQSVADFSEDRGTVLTAVFLQGLGVLAILWFVAALVQAMREAGRGPVGNSRVRGLPARVLDRLRGDDHEGDTCLRVADEGSDLVLPRYHLTVVFDVFTNVLGAGLFLAVGGATTCTGLFARWWGWLSVAAGSLLVIGATAWARDGFWSPTGGVSYITFVVFVVWMLVTSILLTMKLRAGTVGSPTAAPAT